MQAVSSLIHDNAHCIGQVDYAILVSRRWQVDKTLLLMFTPNINITIGTIIEMSRMRRKEGEGEILEMSVTKVRIFSLRLPSD